MRTSTMEIRRQALWRAERKDVPALACFVAYQRCLGCPITSLDVLLNPTIVTSLHFRKPSFTMLQSSAGFQTAWRNRECRPSLDRSWDIWEV